MATELIVIRHGETLWNSEHRMQGQRNSELSELGRAQAKALARRMRAECFDYLYSSDLVRAYETAQAIAAETGHPIVKDVRLRERSFGIFEGLTRAEMEDRHPDEYERFRARDPNYSVPGGETPREFHERCMGCFAEIANRHHGSRIAVVAHGLLLVSLYRAAHGLALNEPRGGLDLVNAGLNVFHFEDPHWRMHIWADRAHLDAITDFQEGGT